jgi:hypothetical protein
MGGLRFNWPFESWNGHIHPLITCKKYQDSLLSTLRTRWVRFENDIEYMFIYEHLCSIEHKPTFAAYAENVGYIKAMRFKL